MTRHRASWIFWNYGPVVIILVPMFWATDWAYRIAILITATVLLTVPPRVRAAYRSGYASGVVDTLIDAQREPADRRPPLYIPEPWEPRTRIFPLQ